MNFRTRAALFALPLVLLVVPVAAQAPPKAPEAAPLLGATPGPFIALSVADLERQIAWYRDTLGFTVSERGTAGTRKIPYAHLRQGSIFIEVLQWPGGRPRAQASPGTTDPVEIHGFFKSGFVVADVAALYRHLQGKGVKFEWELREHPNGLRSFGLKDPEGNLWQFFGS
jgi:uncharacterized glyoxalase superfamily protein PhnB